tara:strand:+ start:324 stop:1535 length:1212 start_codon:yes stop_codon:yes gene_type:complete
MRQYKLNVIAFLISLTGLEFLIVGFGSISIGLIVLILTSFFLLFRYLIISLNYINFILASIVLIMTSTGIYNYFFIENFYPLSHFKIVFKVFVVMIMAFTIPKFFSKISHSQLFDALIFVLRLHVLLLFLDAIFYSPIDWDDNGVIFNERIVDYHRPRGVFAEPSRFALFQSILLSTILFISYRFKEIELKSYDFFLGWASIIVSTSIFGAVVSIILLTQYSFYKLNRSIYLSKNTIKNIFLTIFSITIIIVVYIFFDFNLEYIDSRFINAVTFTDGSTRARIIGGYLSFIEVLQNQPFSGYGGGSLNEYSNFDSTSPIAKYTLNGNIVNLSNTTFLSAIMIASGIISVLFLYSIFIYTLINKYFFYSLIMFLTTLVSGLYYYEVFWISLVIFCYYVKGKKLN